MAYLLDTHALVWAITSPEQLPARLRKVLQTKEVKASAVSYWELMLKKGRPTALVVNPLPWWDRYVTRTAIEVLPVRVAHIDKLDDLPQVHGDPFDRMLVAQALAEKLTLVSKNPVLAHYDVPVVW